MTGTISEVEIAAGCTAIEATLEERERLAAVRDLVADSERIYLAGCGSSYWAAVVAGYLFREAGADATAVHASDLLFSRHPIDGDAAVIGYSRSGETAETVRALDAAAGAGATTVAMTNAADSRLAERSTQTFVTPAGTQDALFATKTVDAALAASYGVAALLDGGTDDDGGGTGVDGGGTHVGDGGTDVDDGPELRRRCREALDVDLSSAVEALEETDCAYALGTGVEYGLAGETATKLGEAALVHTTPQPALEVSHGHVVNVDGDAVVLLSTLTDAGGAHANVLSLLEDASATTVVVHGPDSTYDADVSIALPATPTTVLPALKVVQRLARAVALRKGHDPDFPPGLSDYASRELL